MRRFSRRCGWLLPVLIALAPMQASAWWQNDWSYRKQITVDTTPKGADIAQSVGRMPVLIRLHTGNFSFTDAQENGNDIRFVNAYDKTPLPFHIETFDHSGSIEKGTSAEAGFVLFPNQAYTVQVATGIVENVIEENRALALEYAC